MKRIFISWLLIFCLSMVASATEISISSQQIQGWNYGGVSAQLRIYASTSFITSDGKIIQAGTPPAGRFYKVVPITITGSTATIAAFTLDSTRDAQDVKTARYNAYFFDNNGRMLGPYEPFQNFQVPALFDSGTMVSWPQIAIFNRGSIPIITDLDTYPRETIDAKIAANRGLSNPMTTTGDLIAGSTAGTPVRVPGNSSSSVQFLSSTGTGVLANIPTFIPLNSGHITNALGYPPLNKLGDTMTSFLNLHADPTQPLHAATKQYVDSKAGIFSLNGLNATSFPAQSFAVGSNASGFLSITSAGGVHTFNLASPLSAIRGGTGIGTYNIGDLLYADTTSTLAKRTIGANNNVLRVSGGLPTWGAVNLASDVTGTLPIANGGTGQISFAAGYLKSNSTALFSQATPIPYVDGGTGAISYTTNGLVYAGASGFSSTIAGGNNSVLVGTGGVPTFSATPTLTSLSLSTLTPNSILFAGSGGAISQDSTRLFWDGALSQFNVKDSLKLLGATSGFTGWKAPTSMTSSIIYTLPMADGTNGQVLTTAGNGTLLWTTPPGGAGGSGITSLNGLSVPVQSFAVGSAGSDFNISSVSSTHTFNIPDASSTARGLITTGAQTIAGNKTLLNTLTLASGSTSIAPLKFQSGSLLTTPQAHSIEWDGSNLYATNSSNSRNTLAYTTSNITGTSSGFTGSLSGDITGTQGATQYNGTVPLSKGGTGAPLSIGTANSFLQVNSAGTSVIFGSNGSALTDLNASQLTTGTLSDSRLSSNIFYVDGSRAGSSMATTGDAFRFNANNLTTGSLLRGAIPTTGFNGRIFNIKDNANTDKFVVDANGAITTGTIPYNSITGKNVVNADVASNAAIDWSKISKTGSLFDDLGDVVITSPVTDQILKYDGSNWVNAAGGGSGITSINGDTTTAQTITGNDDVTVSTASGNTTVKRTTYSGVSAYIILPYLPPSTITSAIETANVVAAMRVYVDRAITVTEISANVATISTTNFSFALYSSDGNNRLFYSGVLSAATLVGNRTVALTPAVTIKPGYYWLAWTANTTSSTFSVIYPQSPGTTTSVGIGSLIDAGLGSNGVQLGLGGSTTGGALPTTLGTISNQPTTRILAVKLQG